MSDYKYALEIMEKELNNAYISPEVKYAFKASIEALKKQIPAKPIIKPWNPALCPTCGAELSEHEGDGYYRHYYSKTLCECGQRLEWSL